jgi:putative phosphoribosyl transferase
MALRKQEPKRIVVAVPVAAPDTCEEFRAEVDEIVCAVTPEQFVAMGLWYQDFSQTTDEEMPDLLECATHLDTTGDQLKRSACLQGCSDRIRPS